MSARFACADNVDDYVKSEMARLQIPAVAFAIIKNGHVVKQEAFGFADVEAKRAVKLDDLYEIGSLTKQFTSMGVLILAESGSLNLEQPITKILKDAPPTWKSIKVKNLLYQNSGLPEYVYLPGLGLLDNYGRAQFMQAVGRLPLNFTPGEAWEYSNTNYALLGWLIEDITKEPYAKFIEEHIIRPLKMTHTRFSERGIEVPNMARGYILRRRLRSPSPRGAASIKSDGALITNIADLIKWDDALSKLRLIGTNSYQVIWSPGKLNSGRPHPYGMGWYLNQPYAKSYRGHSGQSAGYSAGYCRFPDAKLSVILLANLYSAGGEAMAKKIAMLFDPTLKTPTFVASPDPDPKRTSQIKLAIQSIAANRPDESLVEQEYILPMRARRNRQAAPANWARLKVVDSIEFGSAKPLGRDTYLNYRVGSGPNKYIVSVLWTASGKLAQATIAMEAPLADR